MKKFDYMKNFRYFLIAALVVVVAGAFVLGFLGFNKDVQYTEHYEIKIVASDIGGAEKDVKAVADRVLKQEGAKPVYAKSTNDGFDYTLIYLFRNEVSADVVSKLQSEMDGAFTIIDVTVDPVYQAAGYETLTEMWWALLAAGILLVLAFFYAAIRYKWAGALAFVFTMAMALYYLNVIREDKKNVANADLPAGQLAGGAFREVFLKNLVTLVAFLVFVIAMMVLGTTAVRFAALQIVAAIVAAVYASLLTGGIYAGLKKEKK